MSNDLRSTFDGEGQPSTVKSAIAAAEIYHGQGTTYLHIDNPLLTPSPSSSNVTGAVVPAISLATTFKQASQEYQQLVKIRIRFFWDTNTAEQEIRPEVYLKEQLHLLKRPSIGMYNIYDYD